jgi:NADPH:quinone reductase
MKSARIDRFTQDLTEVRIIDRPVAEPKAGQVRVRMHRAPINPSDMNFIHGTYHSALSRVIWNAGNPHVSYDPAHQTPCPMPPYGLGGEGMGVVEAIGGGMLARHLKGKRVALASGPPEGTWQESVVLDARRCIALPDDIDDEQGAMFFVNPFTAFVLAREVFAIPRGGWLLITAAGSALGKSMVRLGKRYGYHTICVVRGSAHTESLQKLGADAVIETDSQDLISEVARITQGQGAGYAMDCVGGELTAQLLQCLGMRGHLVLYGTLANAPMPLTIRDLMMPLARIEGFFLSNWLATAPLLKRVAVARAVTRLSREGAFHTEVTQRFTLNNIVAALCAAKAPGRSGKIMLTMK